ncbi:MAG: TIGR00159 family protein [Bacteroidetes bacterium]|nr:MAG: TIGR00159 family protein [Bacteroidota bacterium]
MELFDIGFLTIRLWDIIDILLVAYLLYQLYALLRGSVAINIFIGLLSVYLLWLLVKALEMHLLAGILGQFIGVGVLALIVVFQQEIRRFLILLGKQSFLNKDSYWSRFLPWNWKIEREDRINFEPIVKAVNSMALQKTGAIIAITKDAELKYYIESGEKMNATVSSSLLQSIFSKNSPLHDGAVIINDNEIKAARCVLPLTEKTDLPIHFGLRHRAAIGLTENSDAIALVVSEETGNISISSKGEISYNVDKDKLEEKLEEHINAD